MKYKVSIVYPMGSSKPDIKDWMFDTSSGKERNRIPLIGSNFQCNINVFGESIKSLYLTCENESESIRFESFAGCMEKEKINVSHDIVLLLTEKNGGAKREHKISVECHPGKKSLLESLIK